MNLTISPVSFNNNSANLNNARNNQNFGALKANFDQRVPRIADATLDGFLHFFEKNAQKVGLNTEKLEQQGYKLSLRTDNFDDLDAGLLRGTLLDRFGKPVAKDGKQMDVSIYTETVEKDAKSFSELIKKSGIIA